MEEDISLKQINEKRNCIDDELDYYKKIEIMTYLYYLVYSQDDYMSTRIVKNS